MDGYVLGIAIGVLIAVLMWCVVAFLSIRPRREHDLPQRQFEAPSKSDRRAA